MLWPLAVVVLGLAVALWADHRDRTTLAGVGKMTASTGMIAQALVWGPAGVSAWWIVAGLCLCWVGDLLLISNGSKAFLGGLGVFLLGHVAYAVAFVGLGVTLTATLATGAVMVAVAAVVLRWLWPAASAQMKGPVAAYIVVIAAMVSLAIGTQVHWLWAGAVLFAISDLFVARQRFIAPGWWNRGIGLPLYYAGQVCIAMSLA